MIHEIAHDVPPSTKAGGSTALIIVLLQNFTYDEPAKCNLQTHNTPRQLIDTS